MVPKAENISGSRHEQAASRPVIGGVHLGLALPAYMKVIGFGPGM